MAQVKMNKVDYLRIAPLVKDNLRPKAIDLNNEMTNIYKLIDDMRRDWYGVRYNALVRDFNELSPTINEITLLLVEQIPRNLETICNNYSLVDRGEKITTVDDTASVKMIEIAPSTEEEMRFEQAEVETTRNTCDKEFKITLDILSDIERIVNQLVSELWDTDASKAFEAKFKDLKAKIESGITNIQTEFVGLMKQTEADMQATESRNTVS